VKIILEVSLIKDTIQSEGKLCPIKFAVNIIGGKWKMYIIWILEKRGTLRYNELKRQIVGITDMMLTQCLKQLESDDIVERIQYNEIPPRVEYCLTQEGKSLFLALFEIANWSKNRMEKMGIEWDE
jgi:Predicted transcriptional regulators